ncbi:lymphotoxin-beta isoform X2 [Erinaceus europaeus]|uniref:Lymphotoxin-beta isoform X2 n=1 Tax=Erinaceus europaeus TaxID=9365 RepID=A0A1S3WUF9_ERIEU|nr:lymphotoxin-beta isoform X2 [Erinaceus europaeus]
MEAVVLEERGRKSQGKSCLLLAVAGATSLVTLLLAVPITVLAVLILVPQEQEGLDPRSCQKRQQSQISALGSQLHIL